MLILSDVDKLIIIAIACLCVLIFFICMVCKLSPDCWLHYHCPFRIKGLEGQKQKEYDTFSAMYEMNSIQPTSWEKAISTGDGHIKRLASLDSVHSQNSSNSSNGSGSRDSVSSPASQRVDSAIAQELEHVQPLNYTPDEKLHLGTVFFTLLHSDEKLVINVHEVRDIPPRSYYNRGPCDPFLKVFVVKKSRFGSFGKKADNYEFQSQIHRKTSDPVFNETFVISLTADEVKNYSVNFLLCDQDKFSKPDHIGQFVATLKDVDLSTEKNFTGALTVVKEDLGSMLLVLSYLPTSERITVSVLKVKLPKRKFSDNEGALFKITLICGSHVTKKKRSHVQPMSQEIVFNEAMNFEAPTEHLEKVCFIISFIHTTESANSQELCVSKCRIGFRCCELSRAHWIAMVQSPRKAIAQWHRLI